MFCAAVMLMFCSCDQSSTDEIRHPVFKKARNKRDDGKFSEAAKAFEDYLKINPYSSKCHYELAMLYRDNLDEPVLAIYHFRQFLEMEPDTQDRKNIEAWIDAAEKEYYTQLKAKYPDDDTRQQLEQLKDREKRYVQHLTRLRSENAYLKSQLGGKLNPQMVVDNLPLADNTAVKPAPIAEPAPAPVPAPPPASKKKELPDVYVVKSGDTLSKISKEYYGDIKYIKMIMDANKDTMSSESLQIGQKIRMPKLPE